MFPDWTYFDKLNVIPKEWNETRCSNSRNTDKHVHSYMYIYIFICVQQGVRSVTSQINCRYIPSQMWYLSNKIVIGRKVWVGNLVKIAYLHGVYFIPTQKLKFTGTVILKWSIIAHQKIKKMLSAIGIEPICLFADGILGLFILLPRTWLPWFFNQ